MSGKRPHVLLFSEATSEPWAGELRGSRVAACDAAKGPERRWCWRFVLRSPEGRTLLDVADREPAVSAERLRLLAVVRGLEALDQPSRVTLVTSSRSIRRGLRFGLELWRENQWQWERFGRMTPIKNGDLWQRIDRALTFHEVHCRLLRVDSPADDLARPMPKSLTRRRGREPAAAPVAAPRLEPAGSADSILAPVAASLAGACAAVRYLFSGGWLMPLVRAMPTRFCSSNYDPLVCR